MANRPADGIERTINLMLETTPEKNRGDRRWIVRLILLGCIVSAAFAIWYFWGHLLSFEKLAEHESGLRDHLQHRPVVTFGVAFLIYIVVTGLSLPGATVLSLAYAWFFGFWPALILISFASTTGATLAFLQSRFLIGESIQKRYAGRLKSFNESFQKEGAFFLFTLRLIPYAPFFVVNAVMGLTSIRVKTFWWVSQIGMLPGTMVYVYAGSRVPTLQKLADEGVRAVFSVEQLTQILIAFVLLGCFPLVARFALKKLRRNR